MSLAAQQRFSAPDIIQCRPERDFARTERQPVLDGIQRAVIVYNPVAGGRKRIRPAELEQARDVLRESGIDAELVATTAAGSATGQTREALARGAQLVCVSGGDGTLNDVVNGMAGSQVPLALLPAGTANVLAKELRLPWNIPQAARMIARGSRKRIALGHVTVEREPAKSRYFVCMGGAGADGMMVYSVKLDAKLRWGILAYYFEGARQLLRYSFPTFRVLSAEKEMEASLLVVGRTKAYGGPVQITTEADLFEDSFELMATGRGTRVRYAVDFPLLLLGRHRTVAANHFWKTRSVRVEPIGSVPVYAQVDGECVGRLPVEFQIVPDALTLVVPQS